MYYGKHRTIFIIRQAAKRFSEERGTEAAASLAYYAVFSLFPLLLVLIVIGSKVIESQAAQEQILNWVARVIPFAGSFIEENIRQVLVLRSSVGLIGTLSLAWGATSAFTTLARNINRAWKNTKEENFLLLKLKGLMVIAGLVAMISVLLVVNPVLGLFLARISEIANIRFYLSLATNLASWLLLWGVVTLLYFWIPNRKVNLKAAFFGGLFSGSMIEITTVVFTYFLSSGLARYNLVYGSLGVVMALVFWIYLLGTIILFGAHIASALDSIVSDGTVQGSNLNGNGRQAG